MKLKWKALLIAAALAVPALGWAATKGLQQAWPCGDDCPFPCPLNKR